MPEPDDVSNVVDTRRQKRMIFWQGVVSAGRVLERLFHYGTEPSTTNRTNHAPLRINLSQLP